VSVGDIMRLVGVGVGLVLIVLGVALRMVEARHQGEASCLPIVLVVAGLITSLSALP